MTITRANLVLLLTAFIWGFSFIFQKDAMDYMGPFSFNAFRFLLGGLVLLPLIGWRHRGHDTTGKTFSPALFKGALLAGGLIFIGASFQQTGIQYTSIGNTGFITGLYIIFVPLISLVMGQRYGHGIWFAVLLASVGLYLLSGTEGINISKGDFLVLIGAIFWALHVIVIDHMSNNHDQIKFAALQFFACAAFSFLAALYTGDKIILFTFDEWKWVIASGILSVGMGYTLQVIGQTVSPPAQAAVIMSLEAVFAALAGYLYFDEILGTRALIGCLLMFAGCLLTQRFPPLKDLQPSASTN
ncbi:MAG: EamA family transporter [Alphaproteobacteria bacterium]|nr:MAG: EamA family transporter [Alphaproteobacteria bacterium]